MQDTNFIEAVYERDVDLLLLEEFHCNRPFRRWFWEQVYDGDSKQASFTGAWHSTTHPGLGESDLILVQEVDDRKQRAILVENKVDAPAQPQQAKRYRQRGKIGVEKGYWDVFQTCLVAPKAYLSHAGNASRYDVRVSYEAIGNWFRRQAEKAAEAGRLQYKAEVVDAAIEQQRRGYQPVPHEVVTQFWREYWEYVNSSFPVLDMKRPGKKPAKSDWPDFRNAELGSGVKLVHKLRFGRVELAFRQEGDRVEQIREANRDLLPDDVQVVRVGNSAAFRIQVPKIDRFKPFAGQVDQVRVALQAAVRLLDLFPNLRDMNSAGGN